MNDLLAAIRKACLPAVWAQGSKLAGAVLVERSADDEVVLRVKAPGRAVPPTAVLYPEDLEWACDCGDKADPCAHVVAAAIAFGRAGESGAELASAKGVAAQLEYRLDADRFGNLVIERWVLTDGAERRLTGSVGTEPALSPSHEELTLDRMFAVDPRGVPHRGAEVVALLAGAARVRWAGKPVKVVAEPFEPRALVRDHDGGVELRIDPDPALGEVVARGIGRAGDMLRPLGHTSLTGERMERLPLSRVFPRAELGELVGRVLPEIDKQIPVDIRTSRLPGRERSIRPRIALDIAHREHTLSVLPTLVYGEPPVARIDDGRLVHLSGAVPTRDEVEERQLLARLRDELDLVPGRRVHFDGREAVRYAARLRAWQSTSGESMDPHVVRREPLVARFVVEGDDFSLEFESTGGEEDATPGRADPGAVLRAWRDGLDLVPLDTGGWAPLPVDWLERYGDRIADLLAARGEKGVPAVALPTLASLAEELEQPRPPGFGRLEPLLREGEGLPSADLPADLTATLRHYQQHGVDWLSFLRRAGLGGVLADDMGLGKTLQALCAVHGRTLVVCPKSVIFNWEAEAQRFRPDLRVALYHGPKRELDAEAEVVITSYPLLRVDADRLSAEQWDSVVLDEAQAIKNPDSQVARAAYRLQAPFRVALSGTPVENRLEELWSLMHFANRGLLGGRSDFDERYARPIGMGDAAATERLRQRVRPFVLRRLKRDVAPELPPRSDIVLHVELDERERDVYEAVRAASRREVVSQLEQGGSVLAALEALLRLRQAACHSALLPGQEAESSSKVEALRDALEDAAADGHKALVFSQWTSLLDRIEPVLSEAGIAFTRLDGSTRDRAGVVSAFQSDSGPPVLLASLKAGGTGLNLTAADHVFLMDPWWNPAAEDQAADRAHRIGQDRPVMVYRVVARETVEEGILALQEKKRALADAALGAATEAQQITREDLLALLD